MTRARTTFVPLLLAAALPAQLAVRAEVLPLKELDLHAAVAGRAVEVAARVGDEVAEGAVVVRLAADAFEVAAAVALAAVRRAELAVEIAGIDLEISKRRLSVAERELDIAAERLPHAEQKRELAEQQLAVQRQLFEAGRAPSSAVQQAELDLSRHRETWATIGQQVKAAQDRVAVARLEVQRAERAVAGCRAELEGQRAARHGAELELAATSIRAPFAGRLLRARVAPGELVAARAAVATLVDVSSVRLRFALPAAQALRLRPGAALTLRRDEHVFECELSAVAPVADRQTGAVFAEAVVDNAGGVWPVGGAVEVGVLVR